MKKTIYNRTASNDSFYYLSIVLIFQFADILTFVNSSSDKSHFMAYLNMFAAVIVHYVMIRILKEQESKTKVKPN